MSFGLIHYNAPGDTFEEFIAFAAEAGFGSVEVMIYDVWPKDTEFCTEKAYEAKAILDKHGIKYNQDKRAGLIGKRREIEAAARKKREEEHTDLRPIGEGRRGSGETAGRVEVFLGKEARHCH